MPQSLHNFMVLQKTSSAKFLNNKNWLVVPQFLLRQKTRQLPSLPKAAQQDPVDDSADLYLRKSLDMGISSNPLGFWKRLLKQMWIHDQDLFRDGVKRQKGKQRLKEEYGPSYGEVVSFLEESPDHTVAVDLNLWPKKYICLDIDIAQVGDRILEKMNHDPVFARNVFGYPMIVQTATPGHLHLYYDASNLAGSQLPNKESLPSRLGFKIEYVTGLITLAGQQRVPLFPKRLGNPAKLSQLPLTLYPYNYYKNDNVYTIIDKTIDVSGKELITLPGPGRNQRLFDFFKMDDFPEYHIKAANFLCCPQPLTEGEVTKIYKRLRPKISADNKTNYNVFEISMEVKAGPRKPAPEFTNTQNVRYNKAAAQGTPEQVINFIDFIEHKFKTMVKDEQWFGRSYEYVIVVALLHLKYVKIFYIKEESVYVYWEGKQWLIMTENEVIQLTYEAALSLQYGGIEAKVATRQNIIPAIKSLCSIDRWIGPTETFGYNLDSSIIGIDNSGPEPKLKFIPHASEYMHREIIHVSWSEQKALSLQAMTVLSDLTFGSNPLLHQLRFCIWLVVHPFYGNLGYIFFGPGGAGKSIFTSFIRKLLPFKLVGTIDETLLSRSPASKSTLIKDKALIILPDITNRSLSALAVEFLKVVTGRDPVATDSKYKDAQNFVSSGFVVATTNTAPLSMTAFKDSGFNQRFVQFPLPAVHSSERISNIGEILWENRFPLVNWALSIDSSMVQKNLRADSLNSINSFDVNEVEQFFMDQTVYQKDNELTTKELASAFGDYKKGLGTSSEEKATNYSILIGRSLPDFSQKLVSRQAITTFKKRSARGFNNIALKPTSGKLKLNQEEFKFKVDPELVHQLNQNPFQDHGYLFCKSPGTLQQLAQYDILTEAHNSVLAMSVCWTGPSVAQVSRRRPLNQNPFEHLYNPLADYARSSKVAQTKWFAFYKKIGCLVDIRDKQKPNQMISEPELTERLAQAVQNYLPWLMLKKSGSKVVHQDKENFYKGSEMTKSFKLTGDDIIQLIKSSASQKQASKAKSTQDPTDQTTEDQSADSTKKTKKKTDPDKPQKTRAKTAKTKKEPKPKKETASGRRGRKPKNDPEDPKAAATQAETATDQDNQPATEIKPFNEGDFNFTNYVTSGSLDLNNLKTAKSDWFKNNQNLDEETHLTKCLELILDSQDDDLKKAIKSIDAIFEDQLTGFQEITNVYKEQTENFQYITRYSSFQFPYQDADTFEFLVSVFRWFPIGSALDMINFLNAAFGNLFLDAWALNASSRIRKSDDYFNKQISGTAISTQDTNYEATRIAMEEAQSDLKTLNFVQKGWTLFPFIYRFGELQHGRLVGLPNPGVSGLKASVKRTLLKFIADNSEELNFVELDIKSCHTVVAFSFLNPETIDLPAPKDLWPNLTEQFKSGFSRIKPAFEKDFPNILSNISQWSDDQIKSLVKTQWYKALNNGNIYRAMENLERDRIKFNIPKAELEDYNKVCSAIFKTMPLFNEVAKFQGLLSEQSEIFLPTSNEPFDTQTLSKSQTGSNRASKTSMTAMSRLFTSCEIIVIMLLFITIGQSGLPLLPISYEADGLLLVGKFNQKELPTMLATINQKLNEYVSLVFVDSFQIEFKKPT